MKNQSFINNELCLDLPPKKKLIGTNQRSIRSKHGTIITSEKYRATKANLANFFAAQTAIRNLNLQKYKIKIIINTDIWRGDIDNCLKIILDALQSAGIILSDRDLNYLHIERGPDAYPRLYIKKIEPDF